MSESALDELRAAGDPARAVQTTTYHKTERACLGVPNAEVERLARHWREGLSRDARLNLARTLWNSDLFEARIAAAKVLVQARIKPDDAPVWDQITAWVPDLDGWAISDAVAKAAERRLAADPARFDILEPWLQSENIWTRRAPLSFTLNWAKLRHPSPAEATRREQVLDWAATLTTDPSPDLQQALVRWLQTLSRADAERVMRFLHDHGEAMKPFARREALRLIA